MKAKGFKGFDQTRWSQSQTGKSPGEIDIKFESSEGNTIGIFEGLNLPYLNRSVIENHFKKLFNYDPNGLNENYLVSYCEANDFPSLFEKYGQFIKQIKSEYEIISPFQDQSDYYSNGNEIKVGTTSTL